MVLISKIWKNKILVDLSWSLVGGIISKSLLFLSWIFVARLVGKQIYGEFTLIRSTYLMIALFIEASFSLTLTRYISKNLNDRNFLNKFISSVISIISLLLISINVFAFIDVQNFTLLLFNSLHLLDYIYIILLILSVVVPNSIFVGVISGFQKFKVQSVYTIIHAFLTSIILFFGAKFFNLKGILFAILISQIILLLFNIKIVKNLFVFKFTLKNISLLKGLFFKFTLPAFLAAISVSPIRWICEVSISNANNGFSQLGLLGVAYQLQTIVILFSTSIFNPILSHLGSIKTNSFYVDNINYHLNWILVFYLTFPFFFFPNIFINLFGNDFISDDLIKVLRLLIVVLLIQNFNSGISRKLAVENKMWLALFTNLIFAASLLYFFFYFFENYSIVNYFKSMLIAMILHVFLPLIYMYFRGWIKNFKLIKVISLLLLILSLIQFFELVHLSEFLIYLIYCLLIYSSIKIFSISK